LSQTRQQHKAAANQEQGSFAADGLIEHRRVHEKADSEIFHPATKS
jgi:hypothetical protein